MGSRMVERLLKAGRQFTGYNRTRSKAQKLLDVGMKWGETPRAVAESTEITLSLVINTEALDAVTHGVEGILAGLSAGKIYIDMSTVSPAARRTVAQQVKAKGTEMLGDHPEVIEEGMVFALKTFWPASDGWSAARLEEEVVITKDG